MQKYPRGQRPGYLSYFLDNDQAAGKQQSLGVSNDNRLFINEWLKGSKKDKTHSQEQKA